MPYLLSTNMLRNLQQITNFYQMKTYYFLLFISLSTLSFSQSKVFANIKEIRQNTEKVANQFLNKDLDNLFEELKPYWVLTNDRIDTLKVRTKGFVPQIKQSFGEAIDVVKVKEVNLENVLFKEVYFIRYFRSAIRLEMVYYFNDQGWFINSFEWNDKILGELD